MKAPVRAGLGMEWRPPYNVTIVGGLGLWCQKIVTPYSINVYPGSFCQSEAHDGIMRGLTYKVPSENREPIL